MTSEEIARACAAKMYAGDQVGRSLGIELIEAGPGRAVLAMNVRPDMLNNLGRCHGGIIFTLADCAFAYAGNSRGAPTVTQHSSISFLAAAEGGDRLEARAQEVRLVGRSGVYDISITRQDGAAIAEFRGLSRALAAATDANPQPEDR